MNYRQPRANKDGPEMRQEPSSATKNARAQADHTDALLPEVFQKTFTADGQNDYRANLSVSYVGGTYYLERAWVG